MHWVFGTWRVQLDVDTRWWRAVTTWTFVKSMVMFVYFDRVFPEQYQLLEMVYYLQCGTILMKTCFCNTRKTWSVIPVSVVEVSEFSTGFNNRLHHHFVNTCDCIALCSQVTRLTQPDSYCWEGSNVLWITAHAGEKLLVERWLS